MTYCRGDLVVLWLAAAALTAAQQHNVGPPLHDVIVPQGAGVPLPGIPPQNSFGEVGGPPPPALAGGQSSASPNVPASQGPPGFEVSIPNVHLEHDGSVGVPLPPPGIHTNFGAAGIPGDHDDDPVVVVPISGGSVGVPLPPYDVQSGTAGSVPSPPVNQGGPGGLGAPGGLKAVRDPKLDSSVQRVVQLAAVRDSLQVKTRADTAVKISDIVTAHKQVVSGQLVYLTVRVGETNCPIGSPDVSACAFDHTEDSYVCEVVVWERPWLNSSKVIDEKSRCAETEDDNDFNSWGFFPRLSNSAGETTLNALPTGIDQQQVGIEAFNYIDRGSESKFRGEMVNFEIGNIIFDPLQKTTKIQVDVEYGFNLCLRSPDEKTDPRTCPHDNQRDNYICTVYVVHNPNQISSLEVVPLLEDDNDIHCVRKRSVDEELVVAVRASCTGCPQPVPLNDPTMLEIADFALKEYDRVSDEDELHMVSRLIKAHSQVVLGVKYYLTVELAKTTCRKALNGVDIDRSFCRKDATEETEFCDLHVIDQPWVPARDLVAAQCYDKDDYPSSPQDEFIIPVALGSAQSSGSLGGAAPTSFRTQSALLGAQKPVVIDAHMMEIVKMVVAEYNRREDDSEYNKLVKVHEASTQVVSGKKYHIAVELGETNCHKHDPRIGNGERCLLDPTEEHEVCKAEIHEQAWLSPPNNLQIVSLLCDDLDDYLREKLMPTFSSFAMMNHPFLDVPQGSADLPNGAHAVPTNDSRVRRAASFVAEQFNLREDEDELYILTQVISAHSQAGAGTKYFLEIELAETHCKKYLPVPDPSRCVLDHDEDREVCQAEVVVPAAAGQANQLTKLYCDDRTDYYTNKIRGKLQPSGSLGHAPLGSAGNGGVWSTIDANDQSLKKYGMLIADEFDQRSDDDNLFIFQKILQARKQIDSGVRYHLMVELAETVCPKYKRRINKARCVPDIGEDHMVCEADVFVQSWLNKEQVVNLRCAEKDDFLEGDDSVEVLLPKVHPTAHARPIFRSQFLVRGSDESEESNERFYHPSGRTSNPRHDSDEDDSDELPRFRGRRGLLGAPQQEDPSSEKVLDVAKRALESMDALSLDPTVRAVVSVESATKKVVAGLSWDLTVIVRWTTCTKIDKPQDLNSCETDPEKSKFKCMMTVYERPWQSYLKVTKSECSPISDVKG